MMTKKKDIEKKTISQKLWSAKYAAEGFLITAATFVSSNVAFAKSKEKDYDFLTGESNGTFDGVTKTAKETGASFYQLMIVVGIIAVLVGLVMGGIGFAIFRNPQKKMENKSNIGNVVVGGAIVFGAMGLIGIIAGIGAAIK